MPQNIDKKTVEHVASVARISLSEKEKEQLARELGEVVEWLSKLGEAPVDDLEPTFQPVSQDTVLRDDEEEEGLTQEQALENTKNREGEYFKGPRVFM